MLEIIIYGFYIMVIIFAIVSLSFILILHIIVLVSAVLEKLVGR
jgi:hypothetical protein